MEEIAAVVSDPAGCREFDCILPGDAPVSAIAARCAELARLPLVGPQGDPVKYGFVVKGGPSLDPSALLRDIDLPQPLVVRLVPELSIGSDQTSLPMEDDLEAAEPQPLAVRLGEERCLLHDDGLQLRPELSISAAAHRQIEQFAARDRYVECAGLLLGTVSVERKVRSIRIEAMAPARGAVEARTNVAVTFDAWESMLGVRDRDYPHLRVLGWFHTHAGWGVFLSDADMFVHEHFFPNPNMVAYVLDPTSGHESFFGWLEGEIGQFHTYGLVGPAEEKPSRRPIRPARALVVCAAGVVIACGAYVAFPRHGRAPEVHKRDPAIATRTAAPAKQPASVDRIYILGKRDNLWIVCNRVYGHGELAESLARYNGLRTFTGLQVGQQIKLPSEETLRKADR